MGEEVKKSGALPTREEIKIETLKLLAQQQSERNWCLLRILELEGEITGLKDRAIFLKGASEALKVIIELSSQGKTPNPKHEEHEHKEKTKEEKEADK